MRDFEKFLEKRGLLEELEYYKFYRGKVGLNAEEAFVVALFPFDSSRNKGRRYWGEQSGIRVCAEKFLRRKFTGSFASHICDLIFENEDKLQTLTDIVTIPFYGKYIEERIPEREYVQDVQPKGRKFTGIFGSNTKESAICSSVKKVKSINTFNSVSNSVSLDFCEEADGMGTVEIILIIVVLVGLVIIFKSQISELVESIFQKITSQASRV